MKYLLFYFMLNAGGPRPDVHMGTIGEFDDRDACVAASQTVGKYLEKIKSMPLIPINYECLPKSSK